MGSTTLFVPLTPRSGRVGKISRGTLPLFHRWDVTHWNYSLKRASPRKMIIEDTADDGLVYNKTTWQCLETFFFFFFSIAIVGDWG